MGQAHTAGSDSVQNPWTLCAQIATQHYENFTVGSRLLPRRLRRHLWAVYAYCRTVDDLGDEAPGDRLALLDQWEAELERCFLGVARHPVMQALQETIRLFELDKEPFIKLIEANRQDQRVNRYATFDDVLAYCTYSANPVGHLVLALLRQNSPTARTASDATCTALQLTNFWQDVARDFAKGRLYIPLEDLERFGCPIEDIAEGRATPAFRRLLAFQIERTRTLYREGEALLDMLSGRLRIEVALFSMGGQAVLDAIEAQDYDVLSHRPTISHRQKNQLLWQAVGRYGPWRRRP